MTGIRPVKVLGVATALMIGASLLSWTGASAAPSDAWWKPKLAVEKTQPAKAPLTMLPGQWAQVYQHPSAPCTELAGDPKPGICDYEENEEVEVHAPVPRKPSPLGFMKWDPELKLPKAKTRATQTTVSSGGDFTVSGGPIDTNVAAVGNRLLYTDNTSSGTIRASLDNGGSSWTWSRAATTIFPDNPDGGWCCDQIVSYVPSIRRFIWVYMSRQSAGAAPKSRFRVSVIPPGSITSAGITGPWTYFDITTDGLGLPDGQVDRPEVSFGDNFLYLGFHVGGTAILTRLNLDWLASGTGSDGLLWWNNGGGDSRPNTPTQNAGNTVYWMKVKNSSTLSIYSWAEDSSQVYVGELTVPEFPIDWSRQPTVSSGRYQALRYVWPEYVEGAARSGDKLYFAWGGPDGGSRMPAATNAMVMLASISGANSGTLRLDRLGQWWSSTYALGRPELTTVNGQLGAVMGMQDMKTDTINVLMLNDTTRFNYQFATSTRPERLNRWGDYQSISPWYDRVKGGTVLIASGYRTQPAPAGTAGNVQIANWGAIATR